MLEADNTNDQPTAKRTSRRARPATSESGAQTPPARPRSRRAARTTSEATADADAPRPDAATPAAGEGTEPGAPAPRDTPTPPVAVFVAPSAAPIQRPASDAASRADGDGDRAARRVKEDPPVLDSDDPETIREVAAEEASGARKRRRRGRRGRGGRGQDATGLDASADSVAADEGDDAAAPPSSEAADDAESGRPAADAQAVPAGDESPDEQPETAAGSETETPIRRRRRRRRRAGEAPDEADADPDDPPDTVVHVRETRPKEKAADTGDGVRSVRGSTRLEAKRQRRRDGRESSRRRPPILTEAEFLARRESVDRVMAVRQRGDRTQIAVLEDQLLVEHYVTRASATSYVGNVYLGRVQNVLPSMEAAFVDIGKGRNGVLYAGEVNWDAVGLEGKARTIESALRAGDTVLVQVTKDPIAQKGARLTSQVSLPGRFLVYVPGGAMTGISRKLPDTERHRLKAILKKVVPEDAGVIIRTAAEGASEADLTRDVERLTRQWDEIQAKAAKPKSAPALMYGEPDLAIRVARDVFNEDFSELVVQGAEAWATISSYVAQVAPDLADRVRQHTGESDVFADLRVDEQLTKALDRKVWLPSGGSLVIDRTEAMTVIDVNTGKFVGSGGNLEQTVTRNNLEAAEEVVRQLRLRDVGGIVVIDFIDMVLESNRELVLRRLTECLGRDRTKHQVAEVTSLGLVQMTRKRVGEGLLEAFSEMCPTCHGRGVLISAEPVDHDHPQNGGEPAPARSGRARRARASASTSASAEAESTLNEEQRRAAASAMAAIAGSSPTDGPEPSDDGHRSVEGVAASTVPMAADTPVATDGVPNDVVEEADGVAAEPGPPRPRRRRAASRPAGPPVADSASA
jgi:ribonuclease E